MNNADLNKKIQEAVKGTTEAHKNIATTDDMLDVCSQFNLLDSLEKEEINFLEKQYDELVIVLSNVKQGEKWKHVFPGSGDSEEKEYPYGDYIIYHEVLKFMKRNDSHAIFLTNEKSKSDWMQKDKSPIIGYIEKSYALTNKILFIIHAEGPLKVSFENIHKPLEIKKTLNTFHNINPKYDYYVGANETIAVKSNVLREFIMKYKEGGEFVKSSTDNFSNVIYKAVLDDSEHSPQLLIEYQDDFMENIEETGFLDNVYKESIELSCTIDSIVKKENVYSVFWRRNTRCKLIIIEQFIQLYRYDEIRMEQSFSGTRIALDIIASSTLGSAILTIPLNPNAKDEKEVLGKSFELLIQKLK